MKMFRNPWVLVVLAVVSGLGTQAGVFAWRLRVFTPPKELPPVVHVAEAVPDTISWSFLSPGLERLEDELRSRLETIAVREKELEDYELRLEAERAEMEKLKRDLEGHRRNLEEREAAIQSTLVEIRTEEQKNLRSLAATYSALSPAAALAIFREMDDETVVKILAFMKPEPVGLILEEMARTRTGEGTLAARAAVFSNKLRLKRMLAATENP